MEDKRMEIRLVLKVEGKYYYDIGLRGSDNRTSRFVKRYGYDEPKYLEDFIHLFGKNKIRIVSYGKLKNRMDEINKMLI